MECGEVNVTHARDSDSERRGIPLPKSSSAFKNAQKRNSLQSSPKPTTAMPTVLRKRPRSPSVCDSLSADRASSKRRLTNASAKQAICARGSQNSDAPPLRKASIPSSVRADDQRVKLGSVLTVAPGSDVVATPPPKVKSGQQPPSLFRVPRDQPRRSSLSRSRTPARRMTIKQRPVFSTGGKLAAVRKLAHSTSSCASNVRAAATRTSTSSSTVRSRRGAAALKTLNPNTSHVASSSVSRVPRRPSAKSPKSTPGGGKQTSLASGSVRDAGFARVRTNENDRDDGIDIYVPDEITFEFFHGKTFFVDGDCLEVVQLLWKLKARVAATFGDPSIWAFIGRANILLADDGQQHHQRPTFKNENSRRMRAVVQTLNERKTNFQLAREHGVPLLDYDLVKQAIGVLVPQIPLGALNGAKMYHEPPFLWLCDTELEYKPEFKQFRPDGHDRSTLPTLYLDFSAPVMSPYLDNYPRDGRVVYLPPSGRKDVPRAGYCEICNRNYEAGMAQHITSEYHMHKLRRTDFSNLDNLFKAIDAEQGRESSIFDVPPELPMDSDEQTSSSSSSPISRDVELEMCAPKLSAQRPSLPPTTTTSTPTSISQGEPHCGAFCSVVTPLVGSNARSPAALSETVNVHGGAHRVLHDGVRPSHGKDASALVPRLRALSPASSQSHAMQSMLPVDYQAPHAPRFPSLPSARANSHGVRVGAEEVRVIHHPLLRAPNDPAGTPSNHQSAVVSTNVVPVPPSTARRTANSVALAHDQRVFLPGNLFTGTSSEHLRPLYDLEPPPNVFTLAEAPHRAHVAASTAAQPSSAEFSPIAEAQHIGLSQPQQCCGTESLGSGELTTRRSAGAQHNSAAAHQHGPVESLLHPNGYSSQVEKGQRKSTRNTPSQSETTEKEAEIQWDSEPTTGGQQGLISSRCSKSPFPLPMHMLPPTTMSSHAMAKSARLSPLSVHSKSPSNNTSSFPSPPSFVSIKRKKGSPLPSIMQSGSKRNNRRLPPGVLQQRDKNTLCVPTLPLYAPSQNAPSLLTKHSSHLQFSSSSPTVFYSKSVAPSPSPTAATHALSHTLPRQQNTPSLASATVFHANLPSSSSVFSTPHVQFSNTGAVPNSIPQSVRGEVRTSSSDSAFPLNTVQHHFTSSPVFAEALISDGPKGHQSGVHHLPHTTVATLSSSNVAPRARSFSTDTFFTPELDSNRAAPSDREDSATSSGRRERSSSAAEVRVQPTATLVYLPAGNVADENTLPDDLANGFAGTGSVPLANGSGMTAAADSAHHFVRRQYQCHHPQTFKVVSPPSSSSSSGLVSGATTS